MPKTFNQWKRAKADDLRVLFHSDEGAHPVLKSLSMTFKRDGEGAANKSLEKLLRDAQEER